MKKPYVILLNGQFFSDHDNENDAVRVADRLYTERPRSTVVVLHDEKPIFSLP